VLDEASEPVAVVVVEAAGEDEEVPEAPAVPPAPARLVSGL
jgi:hypothetical protein